MRWTGLLLFLVVALNACASAPRENEVGKRGANAAAPEQTGLIVPGKSIGPISLGMSMNEVVRILGKPNKIFEHTRHSYGGYYYKSGIHGSIMHDDELNVISISTWSSNYRTRLGLTVGANIREAPREFGEPRESVFPDGGRAFCFPQGIGVVAEGPGRPIKYIAVQAPGLLSTCW